MPRAKLQLPDGTHVTIEGTSHEVAEVLDKLSAIEGRTRVHAGRKIPELVPSRPSPTGLLRSLIKRGFFRKPKDLTAIQQGVESLGHFYPTTTLAPLLMKMIHRRELRRMRQDGRWTYVH